MHAAATRYLSALTCALLLAACAGGAGPEDPEPSEGGLTVARPLEVYAGLGLVAGPAEFPVVGSMTALDGPADSSYVIIGLSVPNSALRFQRDGNTFLGQYRVRVEFMRDSTTVRELDRVESVRVPGFAETGRADESVVFQAGVTLVPGRYFVDFQVRDALGSRGFTRRDTLDVPAFGAGGARFSQPLFVYRAAGRAATAAMPDMIVNPRHTLPYGADTARIYVESYDAAGPVQIRVLDESGASLWSDSLRFTVAGGVRHAVADIPPSSLPLGKLQIELRNATGDTTPLRAPLLVTISDQWMVANFDEMLDILSFIADEEELDSLKAAVGGDRRDRWEEFWRRRDPLPATPVNEYREDFFERVRSATLQFSENGKAGWKSDRGEVYIVLGTPDQAYERRIGRSGELGDNNAIEWIYDGRGPTGSLELLFVDRHGFGRFELTPGSEAAFRAAARRLRSPRR